MDKTATLFGIMLVAFCLFAFGAICWDIHLSSTSVVKTIIPISVVPVSEKNGIVMDECFNTYDIYRSGDISPNGQKDSDVKLIYCKENHIPCEVTLVNHISTTNGIASVKITNASKPTTCSV
jgi:hypothetical protein